MRTSRIIRQGALPLIALLLFPGIACTGEYGLTISISSPKPCHEDIKHSLNTCHPEAVIEEMKRYFVQGLELDIMAVRMAYLHGDLWLEGDAERRMFYGGLVSLLVRDDLKRPRKLISYMSGFPFRSMRAELEAEIKKGGHSKTAASRLSEVHRLVLLNYRD